MNAHGPLAVSTLLAVAQRRVLHEVDAQDRALATVTSLLSVQRVDRETRTRITAGITGDRALLDELAICARSATCLAELEEVAGVVRGLRPEVYDVALAQLQDLAVLALAADDLAQVVADLEDSVTAREQAGLRLGTPRGALTAGRDGLRGDLVRARLHAAQVILAVPVLRESALCLTATASRPDVRAVTEQVVRLTEVLDSVDATIMVVELGLRQHVLGAVTVA